MAVGLQGIICLYVVRIKAFDIVFLHSGLFVCSFVVHTYAYILYIYKYTYIYKMYKSIHTECVFKNV